MTLENAIEYYDHLADECGRKASIERNDYMDLKDEASELRQLAIWLNELKMFRESKPKTGKWIRNDNGTYSCSVCQSWIPEEQHYYARYCLYCGARMGEAVRNGNIEEL